MCVVIMEAGIIRTYTSTIQVASKSSLMPFKNFAVIPGRACIHFNAAFFNLFQTDARVVLQS